jgi:hypothetical protein
MLRDRLTNFARHSGAERSEEPGIHKPCTGTMDCGLAAKLVIGPATSGRMRRRRSGMTNRELGHE